MQKSDSFFFVYSLTSSSFPCPSMLKTQNKKRGKHKTQDANCAVKSWLLFQIKKKLESQCVCVFKVASSERLLFFIKQDTPNNSKIKSFGS